MYAIVIVGPFVNSPRRPMEINQLHRIIRYYNSMEWLWKQDYIKLVYSTLTHKSYYLKIH